MNANHPQSRRPSSPTNEVIQLLELVHTGVPTPVADVVVVPLLATPPFLPEAAVLEDAISSCDASVSEVNEGGVVNLVRVENRGGRALLLLDGEVVLGARQHRIFNASFVVAPGASDVVPVSCVEKSRWGYVRGEGGTPNHPQRSDQEFTFSGLTFSGERRSRKLTRVATSVETTGIYDADQREVWRDVDQYLQRTNVRSRTSAFSDGYVARGDAVERALSGMTPLDSQVGVAVLHGAALIALDVFGSPGLYSKCWKKLLRGALAEPLGSAPLADDARSIVENALGLATHTRMNRRSAPGGGETLHGVREGCAVGAAALDGVPYHVAIAVS